MDFDEGYIYRHEHPCSFGNHHETLLLLHAQPSAAARYQVLTVVRSLFILLLVWCLEHHHVLYGFLYYCLLVRLLQNAEKRFNLAAFDGDTQLGIHVFQHRILCDSWDQNGCNSDQSANVSECRYFYHGLGETKTIVYGGRPQQQVRPTRNHSVAVNFGREWNQWTFGGNAQD